MAVVYVKSVPSSEWSRTVWDVTTAYVVGDRVSHQDDTSNKYYVCIQDHTGSEPIESGDEYWARVGSKQHPYYAVDGRLDSGNNSDVYLETINGRYSGSSGMIWSHATEFGAVHGEIIFEDGEYFQPSSALCADGLDLTALNIGKVKINHSQFNGNYIHLNLYLTNTRSKITGINLVMGGSSTAKIVSGNSKLFFDQCILTDENCPYGPANSQDFRIVNGNHWSFKTTLLYFPNASAPLVGNSAQEYQGKLPVWENSTFVVNMGSSNNYSPFFYGNTNPVVNNCIFYSPETFYTNSTIEIGGLGTSNAFYSKSTDVTFVDNDNFQFIDPGFIDPDNGNFSLRPSSPLIGGVSSGENKLSKLYPDGVWVDHNHSLIFNAHNYVITGDGSSYTFSGDITGTDPTLNALIKETLTFNNTGGHPLAVYNSQNELVASESNGTTTFTPKYADTYYYQCTVAGHENMRGDIVVTKGTLGSYSNPFNGYYDAIDSGYYDQALTLLFKEGDHAMYHQNASNGGANNTSISSSFPGGLYFVGENSRTTRLVTAGNVNGFPAFYVGSSQDKTNQYETPLELCNLGIHHNGGSSDVLSRGLFSTTHWKNSTLKQCRITQNLTASARSTPLDYFYNERPDGFFLKMEGCEMIYAPSTSSANLLSGRFDTFLTSCTFIQPSPGAYTYYNSSPCNYIFNSTFNSSSSIKDCIVYTDAGAELLPSISTLENVFSNCCFYSTSNSFSSYKLYGSSSNKNLNNTMEDPDFINLNQAGDEDIRLRPNSALIGGLKKEKEGVYYLQPGNTYNGDGSQKDASAMTANGDPGPFNEFKEIVAAGVPYGSTIVILNGIYDWTLSFGRNPSVNVSSNTWYAYTLAGYNYIAETTNEVIFDAKLNPSNVFVYKPYGGPVPGPSIGTFLDLHTTFTGIQFNNMIGTDSSTRNTISSVSGSADLGSCTFKNCKFLGHINTMGSTHPWTGGGRSMYSSAMHWENCEISIAFDDAGGLLSGGDNFASDQYHGGWSWRNCTFYIAVGMTTFNGRNAANGTYVSPVRIFGVSYVQSQRVFKNNIVYIPGGSTSLGPSALNKLPQVENNSFLGVNPESIFTDIVSEKGNLLDIDPGFVDASSNNFKLRPNSVLIGRGR